MLYRKMPGNNDNLSALGFGTMRLPQKGNKIDEDRAAQQIKHAIDHGVNYIDTAMPYHSGASEPFLGKLFDDGLRDRVKLATKLPPWDVKKKEDMYSLLNTQLKNLNTDYIDYYLIHNLNLFGWLELEKFGIIEFLNSSKEAGKIINCGFSFHSSYDDFEKLIDSYTQIKSPSNIRRFNFNFFISNNIC